MHRLPAELALPSLAQVEAMAGWMRVLWWVLPWP
jgi:hypothetical protein